MRIARILYPVTVLGPGKRIAIWTAGCSGQCKGCANPELWDKDSVPDMDMAAVINALNAVFVQAGDAVDGITVSGGEPFDQAEDLLQLVEFLREKAEDILVFSGYNRAELEQDETASEVLKRIAVLVDGKYVEEQNKGELLRGSSNQTVHMLNPKFRERYECYEKENEGKHLVEAFPVEGGVIAVGIHKKDFKQELERRLEEKGIIKSAEV